MRHTSIVIGALAALGTTLGVLIALAGLPYGRASTTAFAAPIHNGTPAPGAHLAIDCDPRAAGVQDACDVINTAGQIVVDAVFSDSAAAGDFGSLRMSVRNPGTHLFAPSVTDPAGKNGNPDFNESGPGTAGNWNCSFVPHTNNTGAEPAPVQVSQLSCAELTGNGSGYAEGAETVMSSVAYNKIAGSMGSTTLTFTNAEVSDGDGVTLVACYGVDGAPGGGDDGQCFAAVVNLVTPDSDGDGDGVIILYDNCPNVANAGQGNADRNFIDLSPPKLYDDLTRVHSDNSGDPCDGDDDNDGLPDADEAVHPIVGCPSASAVTNPLLADTDGDRTLDRAECMLGFDPASAASAPGPIAPDADNDLLPDVLEIFLGSDRNDVDTDNDGILDGIEFRYYNTSVLLTNTDGDVCSDGREIASINGDTRVNVVDQQQIAASTGSSTSPQYLVNMDLNKNGQVNVVDLQIGAAQIGPC